MNLILISMGVLGVIAFLAACLLYVVSLYFKVEEDPRIDLVTAVLPGANCGGCGFAGCRNFAEACVKANGIDGLACPVGGEPTMEQVKLILVPAEEVQSDNVQGTKEDVQINLLEVNTTPGMTPTSFIPQQVRAAGLDIKDVLTDIIENKFSN
jgi:Na+-translocating ferredoxin:NAD+ oxidoreductase RNF subunit RnfB